MKIAINTRLLLPNRLEGIGWFTYESLKRITEKHPEHQFYFIFDRPFSDEFVFNSAITPVVMHPQARHPFLYKIWFDYMMPGMLKKLRADLFLSPDGYSSLRTDVPCLPVIHDINFAHRPKDLPFIDRWYYNRYFPKFAQAASRIATVSEYSKRDIAATYGIDPERIDVVYNGANCSYTPIADDEKRTVRETYASGHDYFLFIGSLHPRKNIASLIRAFDLFKKKSGAKTKLVIVGEAMFLTADIKQALAEIGPSADVVFTGRLETNDLHRVLGAALALAFVPLFEGFGIPILEAMYADIPVLCADTTSMPEVGGDAVVYADPFSIESIARGMQTLHADPDLRNELVRRGRSQRAKFSWDMTAQKLWNAIEKVFV